MSFNVAALAAYIEDRDFPLIGELQVSPELTAGAATKQIGMKGTSNIHYLETDMIFQDGANCTRSASGTTTFTEFSDVLNISFNGSQGFSLSRQNHEYICKMFSNEFVNASFSSVFSFEVSNLSIFNEGGRMVLS